MQLAIVVDFSSIWSVFLFSISSDIWLHPQAGVLLLADSLQADLLQAQSDKLQYLGAGGMYIGGSVWTQLLTALVVGLLTALAFQFLMTNLGIAIGISLLALRSTDGDRAEDESECCSEKDSLKSSQSDAAELDKSTSHISTMAGLGILCTVNLVLFLACFLAAKFSQANSPVTGAIEGIVIWSAYFLLLLWISSTAVSSLVGSVLGATAGGLRRVVTTLTTALSSSERESVTQAEMIAAIREETQAALEQANLQQMIESQLKALQPRQPIYLPQAIAESPVVNQQATSLAVWQELEPYLLNTSSKSLTPKRVDRKLQKILQEVLQASPDRVPIQIIISEFDRTEIRRILDQREDLTDKKKNRIIDQALETWRDFSQEHFLESNSSELNADIDTSKENESGIAHGVSQLASLLLKAATNPAVKQSLGNLPELLQYLQTNVPNWQEIAPIVLPVLLSKLRDAKNSGDSDLDQSDASDTSTRGSDSQPSTPASANLSVLQQTLSLLADYSQLGLGNLSHAVTHQVEQFQDRSMQQIESIQQAAQERIDQVKHQAQQRLENTRKAAATAAWWLFLTASTAALSSVLAGALATGWTITQMSWINF